MVNRRKVLVGLGSSLSCAWANAATKTPAAAARVVVVGGGFAGASCALTLKAAAPSLSVTLVEPERTYTACPLSNLVVAGIRPMSAQKFGYDRLAARGIAVTHARASDVNPARRHVTLAHGQELPYDRLILAPGIEFDWQAMPGYGKAASARMPHAWQAGEQTLLLRDQLRAMPDGGLVLMAVPESPYRCPPGPYERASLIAHYLKAHKPKSKLLILDAKDRFSKQALFTQAWRRLYGDMVEWHGRSEGGEVVSVAPDAMTVNTDFETFTGNVVNLIPRQRAGAIAQAAGVADASGWCPVASATFESRLQPKMHVIGDAAIANAMPKSAFAADAQAKHCAVQVVRLLAEQAPLPGKLINTCYSLAAPDYGFSVAGVYRPTDDAWVEVAGSGGTSPLQADDEFRRLEAGHAAAWFETLTTELFGGHS